ncbi:hypothetical protein H6P87_00761 [Rickettsia tillamookensis]|uniref:Uncharacterized protein n=1 Tax=Rickettsia tillamookensis TaxID=2761623 RepID=A0A9E6MHI4_9RICK|nr:hypothetical protein H6P87_00761 [Rickettsia tillamookensis]
MFRGFLLTYVNRAMYNIFIKIKKYHISWFLNLNLTNNLNRGQIMKKYSPYNFNQGTINEIKKNGRE